MTFEFYMWHFLDPKRMAMHVRMVVYSPDVGRVDFASSNPIYTWTLTAEFVPILTPFPPYPTGTACWAWRAPPGTTWAACAGSWWAAWRWRGLSWARVWPRAWRAPGRSSTSPPSSPTSSSPSSSSGVKGGLGGWCCFLSVFKLFYHVCSFNLFYIIFSCK